jgi:hypothetical protein
MEEGDVVVFAQSGCGLADNVGSLKTLLNLPKKR